MRTPGWIVTLLLLLAAVGLISLPTLLANESAGPLPAIELQPERDNTRNDPGGQGREPGRERPASKPDTDPAPAPAPAAGPAPSPAPAPQPVPEQPEPTAAPPTPVPSDDDEADGDDDGDDDSASGDG